ncbi:MAG TPA: hypothetical protein H9797_03420 [Candidatus Gallimonas gallistercoris]|uniref:Tetratricopeptide repeat protein n=1 Tax=Candidatus Gallimonas gallistercoris TaxID=2838602 RepID=A0A9D2H1W2_9FIRM|nr:hypothetical protein [Candidatus Gallimonas gallistercoris]
MRKTKETDDGIRRLDFSDEFLLDSAEKRYEAGDYMGTLTMLNKRAGMYRPCADASALYADVYEAFSLWIPCADAWFRFLDTCNEADFGEGYEGLSLAFANMGDALRAELYYRRSFEVSGEVPPSDLDEEDFVPEQRPQLRLIHSDDGTVSDPDLLRRGVLFVKLGELDKAKEVLSEIEPGSEDFPSACGLIAMCKLLTGDTAGAAEECERMLEYHPDNIHALTTYCAVLGAQDRKEEAKAVGRKLAAMDSDSAEDLYRIATALCETGLDSEAYEKLTKLKGMQPYDDSILWFHAVAALRSGRKEEAISSLETLTTVYPRRVIATLYLERLRGDKEVTISYFYRLPEDTYKELTSFLLMADGVEPEMAERLGGDKEIENYIRLAFDQLEGRDQKLQQLAARVAVKCRCDDVVRELLLDFEGDEFIKLSMMRDLVLRNEDNSFGVVICNFYREFYTHKMEFDGRRPDQFMEAFAEVYSRYSITADDNERKLLYAAEDVNYTLVDADAEDLFAEKDALAAAIYREARLTDGEHGIETIANLFNANVHTVKEILNFLI